MIDIRARRDDRRHPSTAIMLALLLTVTGCSTQAHGSPGALDPTVTPGSTALPTPAPIDVVEGLAAIPTPSRSIAPGRSVSPTPRRTATKPALVPSPSPNQWTYAATTGAQGGTGTLVRYRVAVEIATGQSATVFASHVQSTLNDSRGWLGGGKWAFQRVAAEPADFIIWLATPTTTDKICGKYGLNTEGEVSCRGGKDVVINLKRWQNGIAAYADNVDGYRHLVVNHEVGHFLGHGHELCPGEGKLAPVMMTSYYGMQGCLPNPWPYPEGTLVSGPPA